jgi:hypothetical protein
MQSKESAVIRVVVVRMNCRHGDAASSLVFSGEPIALAEPFAQSLRDGRPRIVERMDRHGGEIISLTSEATKNDPHHTLESVLLLEVLNHHREISNPTFLRSS